MFLFGYVLYFDFTCINARDSHYSALSLEGQMLPASFYFQEKVKKYYSLCRVHFFVTAWNCSPPGSSVRGISQVRILEWAAISSCSGIFLTQGSNLSLLHPLHWQVDSLPLEPPGKPHCKVKVLVTQLCRTLCDPMDCSPPASSVHGILQARILEWVAMSFSRGSSRPRNPTQVLCNHLKRKRKSALGKT